MKWMISGLLSVLVCLPAMAQQWQKSADLEALVDKLNERYESEELHYLDVKMMNQVDNLSYFIRYIDQPDTPEYLQLKAFLWGVQSAHIGSINQQIQTNVVPWFCPPGGSLETISHNAKNPTEFIENIIWYGLEHDLQRSPNRNAPFISSTSLIMYGLQTKYPCYEQVPEAHRLIGFNY